MTLGLIVGAVILATGLITGRAIGVASKPKPVVDPPPNLQCGCNHDLSSHDPETNRCHEMESVIESTRPGSPTKYKQVQCICRQYTGDKLIDRYYTPRMIE